MYTENYKAILVRISGRDREKICSNSLQAEAFISSCGIPVSKGSKIHLDRIFRIIHLSKNNRDGEPDFTFSETIGTEDIVISIYNLTGHYSIKDFSPVNLQSICDRITAKYKEIEQDFRIDLTLQIIEGGFNWRWSDQQNKHFAMHEFYVRPHFYNDLIELEKAIETAAGTVVKRYSKNIREKVLKG